MESLWWQHDENLGKFPYREWFWSTRYTDSTSWAEGFYWFYKIPAEAGHEEQLAFRSPENRRSIDWSMQVKKDVLYIITHPGDMPNWGNASQFIDIGPPCGNWLSSMYEEREITRSQTYSVQAAVRAVRELPAKVSAVAVKNDELTSGITATVQAAPELPIEMRAAIMGNPEIEYPIRAAIRSERHLEPAIIASVSKDFSLDSGVTATIQGNSLQWYGTRAAIKGETEKTVGITAFVVKSRADQIMLEMENNWPQELDLRSTPNSPSKFRDWRKQPIGK